MDANFKHERQPELMSSICSILPIKSKDLVVVFITIELTMLTLINLTLTYTLTHAVHLFLHNLVISSGLLQYSYNHIQQFISNVFILLLHALSINPFLTAFRNFQITFRLARVSYDACITILIKESKLEITLRFLCATVDLSIVLTVAMIQKRPPFFITLVRPEPGPMITGSTTVLRIDSVTMNTTAAQRKQV